MDNSLMITSVIGLFYGINIRMLLAEEVCMLEEFQGQCSDDEVIMIKKALYGRMQIGRCVKRDLGHLGCQNNVLDIMDIACSGHQQCTVPMPTKYIKDANQNCGEELFLYMDIEYRCTTVLKPPAHGCINTKPKTLGTSGYISSHMATSTRCGSPSAPWVIDAQPGQTVELWLIDFGALGRQQDGLYTTCTQTLGFVTETSLGVNMTMCAGRDKRSLMYTSKTNHVELAIISRNEDSSRFLIEYKFVGCTELTPPTNAWYRREANEAVIGCKDDDRKWTLQCNGASWEGKFGNCSRASSELSQSSPATKHEKVSTTLPFHSIIVLTGVICAAALLVIIVIVAGVVYIKKQSIKHEVHLRSEYGAATLPPNFFSTNKNPGYDMNTMKSVMTSSAPPLGGSDDNQPLVHIWERTLPDAPGTMRQSLPTDRNTAGRSLQGDLLQ